jgi:tetratricopeptide (TPR) repeat protein
MDLKRKMIWVSAGPNTLGEYIPFALEGFDQAASAPAIPADPLLNSAAYRQYPQYLAHLEQGEQKFKSGHYREALAFFLEARPLNPDHYRSYQLAGEALLAIRHEDEARDNFERALQLQPAFPKERRSLMEQLRKLKAREAP